MKESKITLNSQTHKKILSNLTIVIPTYRRQNHVLQSINFWLDKGPQLLIMDGSPKPIKSEQLKPSIENITYVHSPESIQSRMINSAQYIKTDYVTLCGDDEVMMPSSLVASIEELVENPDLASCIGWAVGFSKQESDHENTTIIGHNVYPRLHFLNNSHSSIQKRLTNHFSNYVPSNIYSVMKTITYKNALNVMGAPGERVFGIAEIEFELAVIYQGGNRVLPNLHWLRNFGDSGNYNHDPDNNPKKMFHDCYLSPKFTSWKEEFLSTRAQALAQIDGQEVGQVRAWLDEALGIYSQLCSVNRPSSLTFSGKLVIFFRRRKRNVLKWLATSMTERQKRTIKVVLRVSQREDLKQQSLLETVKKLSADGMHYSLEELEAVIKERLVPN